MPRGPRESLARAAGRRWGIDPGSIEHVGDSGNSVWRAEHEGAVVFLRLTDASYRSRLETEAEVEFLEHLAGSGANVSVAMPSRAARSVEVLVHEGDEVWATLFPEAPGELVTHDSPSWNDAFFGAWGQALAQIHRGARTFVPKGPGRRWDWRDELLVARAHQSISVDDGAVRSELARLLARFDGLERDASSFGITHADFGPQNFRYVPGAQVTAFDFGNACYHWFAHDLAISLSTLRRWPADERDLYRRWLLAGYEDVLALPPRFEEELAWFLQLRILYVYLDRLERFGRSDDDAHRALLADLRRRVLERFVW